ncbi:MAG TPA: DUF4403 family protein [Pseudolabrys sp.]|jgi:Domain of unknown function (DUF4403)
MRGMLDTVIYAATAPIRLFGRSRGLRLGAGAGLIVAIFFAATLWTLDRFVPADNDAKRTVASLPPLPALQPVTRSSHVIAPIAISLVAIGRSLDTAAPRDLFGKNDNPVSSLLSKADIGITIARGTMAVNGTPNELTVITPLTGNLKITGQIATQAGNLAGTITSLLDSAIGKDVGKLTSKVLDQRAELRGQVTVHSKPALTANWRLEPNLTAQVVLDDSALSLAGIKINMASEAKPLIDRALNEQVADLQARLRNDPFIERSAREQWAKMCRAIPLGGDKTGRPKLWLEMRPVRAAAAQPQVDARNVTLTVGVQAETRIVPNETKPDCPFPATLELVAPMDNGRLAVGVPIDMPFSELNKLLEAQLKGHRFPEGGSAPVEVEVRGASLAAAGDRLLISLRVKARERKSWFGFGAQATVHIWGKPALDAKAQILRLTNLTLAVESEAAFGLLGAAARAAMPYLQDAIADKAVVDLKPFAADALTKITAALADFQKNSEDVRVDAAVHELRLTGIEFDSHTLRVIAEADGTAKVFVTELPKM